MSYDLDYSPTATSLFPSSGVGEVAEVVRKFLAHAMRTPALERVIQELDSLDVSEWEGQELSETQVREISWTAAKRFVWFLPKKYPYPDVTIDVENDVVLEWYVSPGRVLEISVGNNRMLYWTAICSSTKVHGSVRLQNSFPEEILPILDKLYPHRCR